MFEFVIRDCGPRAAPHQAVRPPPPTRRITRIEAPGSSGPRAGRTKESAAETSAPPDPSAPLSNRPALAPGTETPLPACGGRRRVPIGRYLLVKGENPPFHTFPRNRRQRTMFAAMSFLRVRQFVIRDCATGTGKVGAPVFTPPPGGLASIAPRSGAKLPSLFPACRCALERRSSGPHRENWPASLPRGERNSRTSFPVCRSAQQARRDATRRPGGGSLSPCWVPAIGEQSDGSFAAFGRDAGLKTGAPCAPIRDEWRCGADVRRDADWRGALGEAVTPRV